MSAQALLVSFLNKFISQKSFKSASTMSQNNSNNDSGQENHRQVTPQQTHIQRLQLLIKG